MLTLNGLTPDFELIYTLRGHSQAINVALFSSDGSFLLTGGDDGVLNFWDIRNGCLHQTIPVPFHGPVLSAAWTYSHDLKRVTGVLFGCSNGTVQYYRKHASEFVFVTIELTSSLPGGVEEIAFDAHHSRVATANGGVVKLWHLSPDGVLTELHTSDNEDSMISSLFFCEGGEQLVVCYLESHNVVSFQAENWALNWSHKLPRRIGSASGLPNGTLAVTNLASGLDVFNFPPTQILHTYSHQVAQNVRLQIATLCNGELLVVGSDDGKPRVVNRASGNGFDRALDHGMGIVSTVGSLQQLGTSYVVSAASEAPYEVKVWSVKTASNLSRGDGGRPGRSISTAQFALIAVLCCLAQVIASRFLFASVTDGESGSKPFTIENLTPPTTPSQSLSSAAPRSLAILQTDAVLRLTETCSNESPTLL
ncbi:WD40 repeat-like protein [Coprinellus micaceus]|uniref:WD40 repeat-like protein n=1 Tax=Coprinellus micaceus TaxID=71717 RepID=A0A4Y7U0V8_COPMI|nr:WD40 repeat-like protein [Coprinellus micaceus]